MVLCIIVPIFNTLVLSSLLGIEVGLWKSWLFYVIVIVGVYGERIPFASFEEDSCTSKKEKKKKKRKKEKEKRKKFEESAVGLIVPYFYILVIRYMLFVCLFFSIVIQLICYRYCYCIDGVDVVLKRAISSASIIPWNWLYIYLVFVLFLAHCDCNCTIKNIQNFTVTFFTDGSSLLVPVLLLLLEIWVLLIWMDTGHQPTT